jgi:hypothetical protein
MMSVLLSLLLTLRGLARSHAALQLEVLALRHQLQVLQRTRPRRLRLAKADRWLWVWLSRIWTGWRTALVTRGSVRTIARLGNLVESHIRTAFHDGLETLMDKFAQVS